MPKHLPSREGCQPGAKTTVVDPPEYFDFDFRSIPSGTPQYTIFPRPSTAGGYPSVIREPASDRPRTADRPVHRNVESAKFQNECIGLAIGSPTHPPTSWTNHLSPISPQHAFREAGPFPFRQDSTWKKIGGMFRPRTTSLKHSRTPTTSNESSPNTSRSTTSPDYDKSVYIFGLGEHQPVVSPKEGRNEIGNHPSSMMLTKALPLPKLEIEIPRVELERYSVMFKDIRGSSSNKTALLNRRPVPNTTIPMLDADCELQPQPSLRTSTNPSLPAFDCRPFSTTAHPLKQNPSKASEQAMEARRLSVSASAKLVTTMRSANSQPPKKEADQMNPASARQDVHVRNVEDNELQTPKVQIAENANSRSLAAETPHAAKSKRVGQVNHQTSYTPDPIRPKPLLTRRAATRDTYSSPEDAGLSDGEEFHWQSTESLCSSASSCSSLDEEIFFDLRPIQDATGIRGSQYLVIKPDADAVELARSFSLKNKKKQQGANCSPEAHGYQWTSDMLSASGGMPPSWGMPPDVQAAEQFCLSSDKQAAQSALRLSMFDEAIAVVEKYASPCENEQHIPFKDIGRAPQNIQIPSNVRGLAIGIPSPIAEERSCETTPVTGSHPDLQPLKRHIATQVSANPTIIVSDLSATFDNRPPVPRKDSKFLPRVNPIARSDPSSYMVRRDSLTASSRPTRKPVAHWDQPDDCAGSYEYRESPSRHRKTSHQGRQGTRYRAEVSVARTISLTRKPSHKVFVTRQGGSDSKIGRAIQAH